MQVGAGSGPPPEGSTVVVLTTEESLDGAGLPAGQAAEFAAKSGALAIAYDVSAGVAAGASRVIAAGLGPAAEVTSASLRSAVAAAVGALKSAEVTEAYAVLPADTGLDAARVAADATVAAVLADYSFDIYITDEERLFHLSMLTLLSDADIDDAVAGAFAVAQGQCTARDLANTRAGVATPEYMEARAADLCADFPSLSLSTVDVDEMMEKGMGLIYGVGKAAPSQPRIVFMEYRGDPSTEKAAALVGKGLCFDTGGLNLKGSGNIETMYTDKHGACTVLGCMQAIATLGLKTNVVGVMALADNAIDGESQHPHDIVTSMKGLTVHIDNTCASRPPTRSLKPGD